MSGSNGVCGGGSLSASSSTTSGDENQPASTNTQRFVSAALTGNAPSMRRWPPRLRGGGQEPETRRERRRKAPFRPVRNRAPQKVQPAAHAQTQRSPVKPLSSFYSTILCSSQSPPGTVGGGTSQEASDGSQTQRTGFIINYFRAWDSIAMTTTLPNHLQTGLTGFFYLNL